MDEDEKNKAEQDNLDFLRFVNETQKFPLEMEALRTSIKSNESTVKLAYESIGHFNNTRSDNKTTLFATLGVSVVTLIVLIVQTLSTKNR